MGATLSDVASRAGVSVSVASRVLTDAPSARIRAETRERVRAAAKDLGYEPNFAGRALKSSRSNVLALVVPDLTNAIFAELMGGVEQAALARDHTVLIGRSEDMQPGGEAIGRLIAGGRIDGVLVQLRDEVDADDVAALLALPAPVVFINSVRAGHSGSVRLPDADGTGLATRHLVELGHRRIGLIGGAVGSDTAVERERGFREAMAEAALPVADHLVTRLGYAPERGRAGLRAIWAAGDRPTAVVVANLNAAIGVLAEARSIGLRVPQDLSVVAVHDAWTAEHTWPALTTVRMPLHELGRRAVDLLLDRLSGRDAADVEIREAAPVLVVRGSTASPPAD